MSPPRNRDDDFEDEDLELDEVGVEDEEDDEPDEFTGVQLTPEKAREIEDDADRDNARDVRNRRRNRVNVQERQKPSRRHNTPQRQAAKAQQAERENPIAWHEGTALEAPPTPRGMVMRWLRYKIGDRPDTKNVSKKFRQGWKPYLVSAAPEGYSPPETAKTQYGDAIAIGDLLLCIMPRELWKKRQAFYRDRQQRQYKAAHNKFRDQEDPRLPIRQTNRDTFTRGTRRPNTGGDE